MPKKATAYTPLQNTESGVDLLHRFRDDIEDEPEIGTISLNSRAVYHFRGSDLSGTEWDELEANVRKLQEAWNAIKSLLEPHHQDMPARNSNCAVV